MATNYAQIIENENLKTCLDKTEQVVLLINKARPKGLNKLNPIAWIVFIYSTLSALNKSNLYILNNVKSSMRKEKIKIEGLTEEKALKALQMVNDYENNKIAPKSYRDFAKGLLGFKDAVCDTCGDVMARFHNDLQYTVYNAVNNQFPHLIKPITFESAKYNSKSYIESVKRGRYKEIRAVYMAMRKDVVIFRKAAGLKIESEKIERDAIALDVYFNERLNGVQAPSVSDIQDSVLNEELSNLVDGKKADLIDKIEVPAKLEIELKEAEKEPETQKGIETVSDTTDKPVYSNELAESLKEQGYSIKELGEYFGVAQSTIRGRLKKYEESKGA